MLRRTKWSVVLVVGSAALLTRQAFPQDEPGAARGAATTSAPVTPTLRWQYDAGG